MKKSLLSFLFTMIIAIAITQFSKSLFAACDVQSTWPVTVCDGYKYCYCSQTDTYSLPVNGICQQGCSVVATPTAPHTNCHVALNRSKNESPGLSCPLGCVEGSTLPVTEMGMTSCCKAYVLLYCNESD